MFRLAIVLLQILCVLLCPYVCTAGAAVEDREVASVCDCRGAAPVGDGCASPAQEDGVPAEGDCGGECVSRAMAASPVKMSLPKVDEPICGLVVVPAVMPAYAAGAPTPAVGGLTHPELASGHAIRIRFASLLL